MTIEGVFISTGNGKLLYYRNFGAVTHSLFEDFAFSLPQNIRKEDQHTFASHGPWRLIYLPLEELLLVLVTPQNSNIIENIDSVSQFKEVVSSILEGRCDEDSVFDHFVDLTLAFDDMINLKMRNNFSKSQISALLEMESSNERMHLAMLEDQEKEAKRRNEEESRNAERLRKAQDMINKEISMIEKNVREFMPVGSHTSSDFSKEDKKASTATEVREAVPARKGLQLGKKPDQKKGPSVPVSSVPSQAKELQEESEEEKFNPLKEEMKLFLEERLIGDLESGGGVSKFELRGCLNLIVLNPSVERFSIKTNNPDQKHLSVKLPPIFDRSLWSQGIVSLKAKTAPLPKKTPVEILKYSLAAPGAEEATPLSFNFWFSGNQFSCEVEFNKSQRAFSRLDNVSINFRKLYSNDFSVSETENSDHDVSNRYLEWRIPTLSPDLPAASIVVVFEEEISESDVLPADITIDSEFTALSLQVLKVEEEGGRDVKFDFHSRVNAKDLRIV